MSQPVTDDEIYRRKLLMDGDGNGDDSRLNNFIKIFIKWCMSSEETEEDRLVTYEKLLLTLSHCEFSMEKSQKVIAMNQKEMQNYAELYQKIETGIAEAQQKLLECKSELQQAKRIRRNKQEYDALAKVIEEQPDRKGTLDKLHQLSEEIHALQKSRSDLDKKLEKRRKQFQMLLGAVFELQKLVKDENSEPEEDDSQPMDTL